jgi:hypothetical protein
MICLYWLEDVETKDDRARNRKLKFLERCPEYASPETLPRLRRALPGFPLPPAILESRWQSVQLTIEYENGSAIRCFTGRDPFLEIE